jgi:beta-phosphoglucomutase
MKLEAIIFDLEGVIIDTEDVWDDVAVEFLRRHGRAYNRETTKHLMMGKNLSDGVLILQELYDFSGDLQALTEERRSIAKELLSKEINFMPGFLDFFDSTAKNYKTAVASSMEKDFIAAVDKRLHLSKLFGEHIYSIQEIGFISKPNPDIFLYAAKKLDVLPEKCAVIEDAPNGIQAAKTAGMQSIGITTSTTKQRLSAADQIVDKFNEIKF